jgi:tRNA pseudouridine13 synthase
MSQKWPFATADIPAVPGTIKARYEDFRVEEIPAYLPCGEGDHVYFVIEKSGLATMRAVRDIARALGVKPRDIGVAGMKDARAVSRQTLSVEHIDPERIEALDIPRIDILSVSRHRNKLKVGHLSGNRFAIKLRDTDAGKKDDVAAILGRLFEYGVPNYYGSQRFGNRGDTADIGRALVTGDFTAAAGLVAGRPGPLDSGDVLRARELFEAGQFREAGRAWPRGFDECFQLCRGMERFRGNCKKAVLSMDRKPLGLYVSAWQSHLFNTCVAQRIKSLHRVKTGDVAYKHLNGAPFLVEDAEAEQPRAAAFEISATGPMFGYRMRAPTGSVAEREARLLEDEGIRMDDLPRKGVLRCTGVRRPIRFKPEDPQVDSGKDEHGEFLEVRFTLPSGCYATSVLGEICKERLVQLDKQDAE